MYNSKENECLTIPTTDRIVGLQPTMKGRERKPAILKQGNPYVIKQFYIMLSTACKRMLLTCEQSE